jgi:cytidylate kinase
VAVITISRQFGAGGRTLGKMISKQLGYRLFDDLIIREIAKHAKVSKNMVISMERTAGGTLSKLISSLISSDYIDRLMGDGKGYMDEEIYVQVLHDVMVKLASEGDVVLIGRGGQYVLNGFEGACHIYMVADMADRVKFMQKHYNLSDIKAEAAVMKGEKKRANLYKKFGKKDFDDSNLYHMTLNMSRVSLEKAVALACDLVKK